MRLIDMGKGVSVLRSGFKRAMLPAALLLAACFLNGACADIDLAAHIDTRKIIIDEVHWLEARNACTTLSRPARACAIWKDHVCRIVVPVGNVESLKHELTHCREGGWHL